MIRRGDVYLARIDAEGGQARAERAVVVISRDSLNQSSPVVVVVPVVDKTSRRRIYPSQTIIRAGDGGLTVESVALGEQVRAISVSRLGQQLGHLATHTIAEVSAVLKIVLDL